MMAHHAQREHVRAFGKDAWQFGAQKAQPLAQPQPRAPTGRNESGSGSRSPRESQNAISPECDFELGAGLARPRKASRQSRPASLPVPPLILRLVTWLRMSFSDPLG